MISSEFQISVLILTRQLLLLVWKSAHCSNIDVIYIVKYEVTSAISLAVSRGHLAIHCHLKKLLLLTKKANKLNLNLNIWCSDQVKMFVSDLNLFFLAGGV